MTRQCAHPKCGRTVAYPRQMCGTHWFNLPSIIKARISALVRSGEHDAARIALNDYFAQFEKDKQ